MKPEKEQPERAAVYCRLSREDAERRGEESESIQNQKQLLLGYAAQHDWPVCGIYCDEDYSGADRTRPAFRKMLSDAETGRFDILLVKTQSRFTRDMELVEKYLHGLFPQWGVRFIAVVDHADTAERGNKKARQISGLVNEWYLEDLSENVRAVLDNKRRAGQYIGACPLYGYQKDPADKNHLVPDAPAAAVVQYIFSAYLAGMGTEKIAQKLNLSHTENPSARKRTLGYAYRNGRAGQSGERWNRTAVRRILENPMYTGVLVQGKVRRISYKSKHLAPVPPEQWFITPGAHRAIVSEETFAAAQQKLARHGH